MLRKLLFLLFIAVAISCQQELKNEVVPFQADVSVVDGRLVFKSESIYMDTKSEVERLDGNLRDAWAKQYKYKPLVTIGYEAIAKIGFDNLSPGHLVFLNADRLIQIGDEVVYFSGDTKYYMNVDEYNQLENKSDIVKAKKTGKFIGKMMLPKNDSNGRIYFEAWNNGNIGVGGSQLSFSYGTGRKFLDLWVCYVEQVFDQSTLCSQDVRMKAHLWLRPRLEMKSGGSWVPCYERRDVSWNFSIDTTNFLYGKHLSSAGCAYIDTSFGPYATTKTGSATNLSSYYDAIQIIDVPAFDGEWHATVDLKNWQGYGTGTLTQSHQLSGVSYTYTF